MPFTFPHPAAAILFSYLGLIPSASIVGSITPDLMYFACLSTRCQFCHTLLGFLVFCMPVSFILLWPFHTFFKLPLLSCFPSSRQQRLLPFARGYSFRFLLWQRFLLIIFSLYCRRNHPCYLGCICPFKWLVCEAIVFIKCCYPRNRPRYLAKI